MDYLAEHKKNVQKAWDELKNATMGVPLLQRPYIVDEMNWRVKCHDDSKFSEEEFVPYRQHFYPDVYKRQVMATCFPAEREVLFKSGLFVRF